MFYLNNWKILPTALWKSKTSENQKCLKIQNVITYHLFSPCCEHFCGWVWVLDLSLMIGWKKSSWSPERVSSVFTFVCVYVHGLQSTPFDLFDELNFWVELSLGLEKETHFFPPKCSCLRFLFLYDYFSLYNTSKFSASSYRSQFFT